MNAYIVCLPMSICGGHRLMEKTPYNYSPNQTDRKSHRSQAPRFIYGVNPKSLHPKSKIEWHQWPKGRSIFDQATLAPILIFGVTLVTIQSSVWPRFGSVEVNHVNYPALTLTGTTWASDFTGDCRILDLRPRVGLTSPPSAAVLVPKTDSILIPSALMFLAALESLSWLVPQLGQVHVLTSNGIPGTW